MGPGEPRGGTAVEREEQSDTDEDLVHEIDEKINKKLLKVVETTL